MLRLARLILVAQSAARKTNDHCSCHSVKSKTFTRLMFERGFRAAAAPSNLKLSPPPRRDLMKPVLEELWRSLRAERRQVTSADGAARELARALNETGDWVLVYNNRVYVATEYYHAADHARHVTMIRETAALVGLPNAIYAVNTGTRGPNGCNGRPVSLTINKQSGYEQCGVLIPNIFFDNTRGSLIRWARENEAVEHDVVPFSERRPVAFYRGSLHHDTWSTEEACASTARRRSP